MKAAVCARYGGPEVIRVSTVAKPTPRKNELCIGIFATAVTASDCIIRSFNVPLRFRVPMGLVLGYPRPRQPILGLVLAGEVESVGPNVTRFKAGDQVYAFTGYRFGAHAEYTCLPEDALIAIKPSTLTYDEAAALPYGGMLALHFLRKGNTHTGQRVLVYGASGAIGTSAVQLARYLGASVAGVCSGANLDMVKGLGADPVIDYTREDFTKRGERYDLIFNAVGKRKAQLECQDALTPGGRHMTVDDGRPKLRIEDLLLLKELAEDGRLKPVIDRTYPLERIVEAYEYVDKGHKKGNVVITVGHNGNTP